MYIYIIIKYTCTYIGCWNICHALVVMATIVEDTEMPKLNAGIFTASVLISIVSVYICIYTYVYISYTYV
jgi:hypothetical protein